MKRIIVLIAVSLLAGFSHASSQENDRYYLFIAQPSPEGWQWLMKNPSDRKAAAEVGIKKLGGEILSYYWGVNDGRNYITVRLPNDAETVPALLILRMSSGLLMNYEAIELMPSKQLPVVLKKINDIVAADGVQPSDGGPN